MNLTELGEGDREVVLNLDRVAALVDDADAGPWHLAGVEHSAEAGLLGAGDGDEDAAGGFGEQPDERVGALGSSTGHRSRRPTPIRRRPG